MMARGKLLGGLAAGWMGLMLGACGGASMQEAQEDVGTSEAAIEPTTGKEVSTVYYSDNTLAASTKRRNAGERCARLGK